MKTAHWQQIFIPTIATLMTSTTLEDESKRKYMVNCCSLQEAYARCEVKSGGASALNRGWPSTGDPGRLLYHYEEVLSCCESFVYNRLIYRHKMFFVSSASK